MQIDTTILTDNVKAVFLLYLALTANFLGNTLNCGFQKRLLNNALLRNIAVLGLIYFTVDFTNKSSLSPLHVLKNSFVIYVLFIILTKQTFSMFLLNLLLIFTVFILTVQSNYEKENNKNYNNEKYTELYRILEIILIITLTSGFYMYYHKQSIDHKDNFNLATFILGTEKCEHT